MSETCAVCGKGKGPEKCEVCGFSDNGSVNRQFPIPEDAKNWIDTVVKPYRTQWEAKKREAELLAQLKKSKKRETELLAQLEESHKRETKLKAQIKGAKKKLQELTQLSPSPHAPEHPAAAVPKHDEKDANRIFDIFFA